MRIIIAEDDENSRIMLESLLEGNGYEVESAENGKRALGLAVRRPPDLIISDILMPEMDGYVLCREVKNNEQLRDIPFVFYTATYTDPNDEKLAMELGASRFIVKPMEVEAFLAEICKVLKNHNAGHLPASQPSVKGKQELLDNYTAVLAKKLDKKVHQLEEEKKQLAEVQEQLLQSQKMEALGRLAGGIAHDVNNVLMPIICLTEMTQINLQEGTTNWENLQKVLEAADQIKELVRQILLFSRHVKEEKQSMFLQTAVGEVLKLLQSTISPTIEIRKSIDPHCAAILANPTQMHQVLMNLCTNALYAMRDKRGILDISLAEMEITSDGDIPDLNIPTGKYLRLEISDTGTGIEKDKLGKIFDPYFTTKPKDEGTGLGLAIVRGIVDEHGGHLAVHSELGKGTTFHLYFPLLVKC